MGFLRDHSRDEVMNFSEDREYDETMLMARNSKSSRASSTHGWRSLMLLDLTGNQNIPLVITPTVMFGVHSFIFCTAYHKLVL
jgi:hypothetical protein